jgi:3-oxoadipate enol-lactonase
MTVRLHHVMHGSATAPALVLGGSLGTTLEMWSSQLPALTERFRVVTFDHRGHGESDSPETPCSLDDLGADVVALLDRLSLKRVSYAGLSLGGMIGMWLAANVPDRIDRLALLCTSANLNAPQYWHSRAALVRADGMKSIVDPVVERWFTPTFAKRQPAVVTGFKDMIGSARPMTYAACCDAIATMDLTPSLPTIAAPTIVVAGGADLAIPIDHGRAIAEAIPLTRLVVAPDAAHLANVEQPDLINELLIRHLAAEER